MCIVDLRMVKHLARLVSIGFYEKCWIDMARKSEVSERLLTVMLNVKSRQLISIIIPIKAALHSF